MIIVAACLLLLVSSAYAVFRYSRVQTWVVHWATGYLSVKLNTNVSIRSISVRFPKKIVLEGLFMEDQHQDTLMYADEIKVDLKRFSVSKKRIVFNAVHISNTYFNLEKYKGDSALNLDFILNAFSSTDTSKGKPWGLELGTLALQNCRFNYINEQDTSKDHGINYQKISAYAVNADIETVKIVQDSIFCNVKTLSLKERSGFVLEKLATEAKIAPDMLDCRNLVVKTHDTKVSTQLRFTYHRYSDYLDFNNKVMMLGDIKPSQVSMADIAYFAPALWGMHTQVLVSGKVSGTVAKLKAKNLDITLGRHTKLRGNVTFMGLPDIERTYMDMDVENFQSSRLDLQTIPAPPFAAGTHLQLPENIENLGIFKFNGHYNGFIKDFTAYGSLETDLGNVTAKINFKNNPKTEAEYIGHISSEGFNVGKLYGAGAYFDVVSLNADIKGNGLSKEKINADINGNVYSIGINSYVYKNITINGHMAKGLFAGKLAVKDENVDLSFEGGVDVAKPVPVFNFSANIVKARLAKLHILQRDSSANLSGFVSANFKGRKIDDIEGTAYFKGAHYYESGKNITSKEISFSSGNEHGRKILILKSEFADATIQGRFLFNQLPDALNQLTDHYIENINLCKSQEKLPVQELDMQLSLKNISPVTKIFMPDVEVAPNSTIKAFINSASNTLDFNTRCDYLRFGNTYIRHITVRAETKANTVDLFALATRIEVSDSVVIDSVYVKANTAGKDVPFTISANRTSGSRNKLGMVGTASFNGVQQLHLALKNADILLEQEPWGLEKPVELVVDSMRTISTPGMIMYSNNQKLSVSGAYTFLPYKNTSQQVNSMSITLENIGIDKFNTYTRSKGFLLEGILNGTLTLYSYKNTAKIAISSNTQLKKFSLNGDSLGVLTTETTWSTDDQKLHLIADLVKGEAKILDINGSYALTSDNSIDFTVNADKIYLQLFSRYLKEYITNLRGLVSCNLKVTGTPQNPLVKGKLKLQRTSFIVNYLNTQYSLSDEIDINPNSIDFNDITVNDFRGNTSTLSGKIHHNNFRNIRFDVSLIAKNFQFLNTTMRQNDAYYGTAYASGKVSLRGPTDDLVLDIAVKTQRETRFFMPLSGVGSVEQSDFITFINADSTKKDRKQLVNKFKHATNLSGFTLNMDLEVTPDAEAQLIFDSKIGDVIKARGTGNIKLSITTLGDFNMYGDYTIDKGDYLFTLKNLTNKHFQIEKGGTITWNGNPEDAEINLVAVYKLKAALQDLLNSTEDTYKKRVPVECKLDMTGKLMNPTIVFEVIVPAVEGDETISALVKNVLNPNRQDEVNNQMLSLLLLGSFAPPAGSAPNPAAGNTLNSGFGSNYSEILSNQLSNMASQLGKSFSQNVDFNINYRRDEITRNDQMDVGLSTQLFNDRVILNGSVGKAYNQNTSSIVGDFVLEVLMSKDGRLRFKASNKSVANNYNFIAYNSPYTQSAGFSYNKDFSSFRELINLLHHRKRTEEAKLKERILAN